MSETAPLKEQLERAASAPAQQTVLDLIERMKPALARVLPEQIGAERFTRTVLTEIRRTPKLLECQPESLLGAMMLAAQLGLEPGPLGHVYLVPFKGQVEFIIGYKGYIDLAFRSAQVKDVAAAIVYEGDEFDFREGTRPFLDHRPAGPPGERTMTHAYAVARLRSGGAPFMVIYPDDWQRAQKRSAAGAKNVGPWVTDFAAQVRKTAVRRLSPFLPQSPVWARALGRDEQAAPVVVENTDGSVELDESEVGDA